METKFLCDAMLARLARYLRAAGYDTALADNAVADRVVVRQAVEEGRWLITADRKIIEHKAARGRVVMLPHGSLDAQAEVLGKHFAMDWTGRAFSRCLLDNALLVASERSSPAGSAAGCPGVRCNGHAMSVLPAHLLARQPLPPHDGAFAAVAGGLPGYFADKAWLRY